MRLEVDTDTGRLTVLADGGEAVEHDLWSPEGFAALVKRVPEAAVAIQVSGSFGSRQEEAQRLGRLLRPKADGRGARFYAVVARDTDDQHFAAHRQRFLAEQGYAYRILDADDVLAGTAEL